MIDERLLLERVAYARTVDELAAVARDVDRARVRTPDEIRSLRLVGAVLLGRVRRLVTEESARTAQRAYAADVGAEVVPAQLGGSTWP